MSEKKGLFGGEKKSSCCSVDMVEQTEANATNCSTGCNCKSKENDSSVEGAMSIKILGPGCKSCVTLFENAKLAIAQMNLPANLEKVTDLSAIASYGVMFSPGIVINEKVVSSGKLLKPKDIIKLIEQYK